MGKAEPTARPPEGPGIVRQVTPVWSRVYHGTECVHVLHECHLWAKGHSGADWHKKEIAVQAHVTSRSWVRMLSHGLQHSGRAMLVVARLNKCALREVRSCPDESPPHLLASVSSSAHRGWQQLLPAGT